MLKVFNNINTSIVTKLAHILLCNQCYEGENNDQNNDYYFYYSYYRILRILQQSINSYGR